MNKKRLLAILMVMILLISNIYMPIAYAQFDDREFRDPREIVNLGEVIAINVKSYEPSVVPASLLEDDNQLAVYAFLEGYTLGSFLGQDRPAIEPLYGTPNIKSIQISTINSSRYVRGVRYIRPSSRVVNLNDLGILVINLARVPRESDVPGDDDFKLFGEGEGRINVEMLARIYFNTERLVEFGEQSLLLEKNADEIAWRNSQLDQYSFWGKRGYIRVVKIDSTSAVYDLYDGSLRKIASGRGIRIGQIDGPFGVTEYGRELLENRYRVRLDSINEPGVKTAKVKLSVDGETLGYKILKEGETLYPGSAWSVKTIERTEEKVRSIDGTESTKAVDRLIIRKRTGEEYPISKTYGGDVIESSRNVCEVYSEHKYCKAIEAFSKVIDRYANVQDEDGVTYGQKASYWIGKSYDELSKIVDDAGLKKDAREKAVEYYGNVNTYNEVKEIANLRIEELNKQINENSVGENGAVLEGSEEFYERNIEIELIGIDVKGAVGEKPSAVLEINGQGRTIEKGSIVINGWMLDDVLDNSVRLRRTIVGVGAGEVDEAVLDRYKSEIDAASRKYSVDANLIKAVIWKESTGNPSAIRREPDGRISYGLMQVLCTTAKGNDLKYAGNCEDMYQPAISIDLGTNYLSQQLRTFNNNVELALVAYNSGPGNVRDKCGSTFSSCSGLSPITQDYVPDVVRYRNEISGTGAETREVIAGKTEIVDNNNIRLVRVDLKKLALFTIVPGSGAPLYSESRFSVHIPIEKRAIELTPRRIDKELNKTQERIEKLDKTIAKLEDLVKRWKALCLAVFAYLTLKNSFFSGLSRSKAREQVMNEDPVIKNGQVIKRGDADYNGWKDYCSSPDVLKTNGYATFDQCISENSADITKAIDQAKEDIDEVNSKLRTIDDITKAEDQQEFSRLHGLSQGQVNTLVKYNQMNAEDARRLTYLKVSGESGNQANKIEYQNELNKLKADGDKFIGIEKTLNEKIGVHDKSTPAKQQEWEQAFSSMVNEEFKTSITKGGEIDYLKKEYPGANLDDVVVLQRVYPDKTNDKYYTFDKNGDKLYIEKVIQGTQPVVVEGKQVYAWKRPSTIGPLQGPLQDTQLYLVENNPDYRSSYATKTLAIEYNQDYTPYLIPIQDRICTNGMADYIKVEHENGRPTKYNIFNVGQNGKIDYRENYKKEINDDQLHVDDKKIRDDQRLLNCVTRRYNAAIGRYKAGQAVPGFAEKYVASFAASRLRDELSKPKCSDVMDPSDCRILYNVCDPVMCPISRFNLGGRWQLAPGESVVSTGIIGSLILGMPNWQAIDPKGENTIPPVCVTGVLAGLKQLRSVLQGYQQCLLTAKVKDQSVGICDRIRSVFMCEILWREAIAIFKVHGSLVGLVSKALGESDGGGEYLTFESSVENAGNSVEFFTREYASTAFAAYQSRSTAEIGTEICKAAIFGEFPGIGSVVDELSRPENPPQFTAVLSTMPFSETLRQSRYNVFYHIYAGTDVVGLARGPLRYSVFLRDPSNIHRVPFYVTERCNGVRAAIPREGFASHSVDCTADDGFTEVCVEINGITKCGFGKVSSSFALNYVNDLVVANEVRKEINSQEECMPDDPRYSTSLGGLIAGNPGILNSGVQRFCSVQNPGAGTNTGNEWRNIGNCGKDKDGRSLGTCWLDVRSMSIKDTELLGNVSRELDSRGYNLQYGEEAKAILDKALEENKKKGISVMGDGRILTGEREITERQEFAQLLDEYTQLLDHFDDKIAANAQFMIGMIYFNIDDTSGLLNRNIASSQQQTTTGQPSAGNQQQNNDQQAQTNNQQTSNIPISSECKLMGTYWEKTIAKEDEEVKIIIESTKCNGQNININIYEDDLVAGMGADPIETITNVISSDKSEFIWKTKWVEDGYYGLWGNPEYRFTVVDLTKRNSILSRNDLTVVR